MTTRPSPLKRLTARLRRIQPDHPTFGIWESHTNLIHNDGAEANLSGWTPMKVSFKDAFSQPAREPMMVLGGDINQVAILDAPPEGIVDEDELWRAAREYVEKGATFSPTVLTGEAISKFFRFCDLLREQGQTIGVLTEPVRVGLRRLPAGTECEMTASFTDGRSILKYGRHDFEVYFDQHYLTWRWNENAELDRPASDPTPAV